MGKTTKRVLLTAGAIFSFVTMFALFGLIFYQLFRPNSNNNARQGIQPMDSKKDHNQASGNAIGTPHPLSGTVPQPSPKLDKTNESSIQPVPSSSTDRLPSRHRFRSLEEAKSDRDRALLLVQNVNLNPNSTWSAQLNKYAIGLKPLNELFNFSNNVDPWNNPLTIDPKRFNAMDEHIVKAFHPYYDHHLDQLAKFKVQLPARFNAAQRWGNCAQSILRVRDQGGCGSCWAVAAASVISDRHCIASGGRLTENLSAQQLIECCDYCGGCTGAPNSFFPFFYWHLEGLVTDRCFPYTIARDCGYPCPPTEFGHPRGVANCSRRDQCVDRRERPIRHRALYVYKIGSLDENDEHFFPRSLFQHIKTNPTRFPWGKTVRAVDLLKRELMAHGPLMLCFSVYEGFMHYYEGVYNFDLVPGEAHVYDHCAKVIGWGRQRRLNAVKGAAQNQEYLLLVNSWSALWAKDGTFKMDLDQLRRFHSDLFAGMPAV